MCGIVGYVGNKMAVPLLLDSLKVLEYRGYDSAGISFIEDKKLNIVKTAGKIANLDDKLKRKIICANIGIGHTRWATHGKPNKYNSHPFKSFDGKISIVHNGIIENYKKLKEDLNLQGICFQSDTDSELIAHLLALEKGENFITKMRNVCKKIMGSYALAVLNLDEQEKIYVAKNKSPLVFAKCDGGAILASDVTAILKHSNDIYTMNDFELAEITASGAKVYDFDLNLKNVDYNHIETTYQEIDLQGYPHYMIKEIYDIPNAIFDTFSQFETATSPLNSINKNMYVNAGAIHIIACGTSYHAGLIAFERLLQYQDKPVYIHYASEFLYGGRKVNKNDICIFISQSGETADTLLALSVAKKSGAVCIGVTNRPNSSMEKNADLIIPIKAGVEIAVASTKAYNCQVVSLLMLVNRFIGFYDTTFDEKKFAKEIKNLQNIALKTIKSCNFDEISLKIAKKRNIFFVGMGIDYYLAMEASLKLKEITYIHSEALVAGELKHGTLALIDDDAVVVVISTQEQIRAKIENVLTEIKTRGATVILASSLNDDNQLTNYKIKLPVTDKALTPIVAIIPFQMLAYKVAIEKCVNPDQPRNLAKSVTVE